MNLKTKHMSSNYNSNNDDMLKIEYSAFKKDINDI